VLEYGWPVFGNCATGNKGANSDIPQTAAVNRPQPEAIHTASFCAYISAGLIQVPGHVGRIHQHCH